MAVPSEIGASIPTTSNDGMSGLGANLNPGYMYNGGAANGKQNYDRSRSIQGGKANFTYLTVAVTAGTTSLSLSNAYGLTPGSAINIQDAINGSEQVYVSEAYVPSWSGTGNQTVPLRTPLLYAHAAGGSSTLGSAVARGSNSTLLVGSSTGAVINQFCAIEMASSAAEIGVITVVSDSTHFTVGAGTQRYHGSGAAVIFGPLIEFDLFDNNGPQLAPVGNGGEEAVVMAGWDPSSKHPKLLAMANQNGTIAQFLGVVPILSQSTNYETASVVLATSGISDSNNGQNSQSVGTVGYNGSTYDRLRCDANATGTSLVTVGGSSTTFVATGAANTVVKNTKGRLCRISVTAAGTTAFTVYDNASTNSGNIIFASPATTVIGTVYDIQIWAVNGITLANTASGPALAVSWN